MSSALPPISGQLTVGPAVRGSFDHGLEEDYYAIDLAAGQSYLFSLKTLGPVPYTTGYTAFALAMLDAGGNEVVRLQTGYDDSTLNPVINFTPQVAGTYYLAAVCTYGWYALGAYEVSAAIRSGADDYTDNLWTGGLITPGSSISGRFEVAGDHDWIRFHAEKGTHYSFTTGQPDAGGGSAFPSEMRILDASGKLVSGYPSFDATQTGDYYLDLQGLRAGNYTIVSRAWADDFPATNLTTGTLTGNSPLHGAIGYQGDTDRVKVTLEAGKFYELRLKGDYSYYHMTLYDAAGERVDYSAGNDEGEHGLVLSVHPAVGGDYYLDIEHMLQSLDITQGYDYQVELAVLDKDDAGDTPATANALAVGGTVNAATQSAQDIDVYKVTLTAGASYGFVIRAEDAQVYDLPLRLTDAAGNVLAFATTGTHMNSNSTPWITFTPTTSGDYYLNLESMRYGTINYQLQTQQLTGDLGAPRLLATTHADGATDIALGKNKILLTFDEMVIVNRGAISLVDSKGNSVTVEYLESSNTPIAVGNTLQVRVQGLLDPGTYTLKLPHGAVHDLAGNAYNGPETFTFTTTQPSSIGTRGNDLLLAAKGDVLDGRAGIDMAVVDDLSHWWQIQRDGTATTLISYFGDIIKLDNIERVQFGDHAVALDIDGNAGKAYRLYQAAFNREPDLEGLGYWISHMDHGSSLREVASSFVRSNEFTTLYGANPTDGDYVTRLYQNVLHRAPEQAGYDFWMAALANGTSREEVLTAFGESGENKAALIGVISGGIAYLPF